MPHKYTIQPLKPIGNLKLTVSFKFGIFTEKKYNMVLKSKVIEALNQLPDQFSIDDLMERLIVLEKIETGLKQVEEGKTLTMQEAKERLQKWLK